MKLKKQLALVCPIDAIGASVCQMVAFSGFYESHEAPPWVDMRGIVRPHRDDHQNGHQSGYILHRCFVCCHPGGCRGDTQPVVARWRRPVASSKALVILHWAMRFVPFQRLLTAIKMACSGDAFVRCHCLFQLM